MCRSTRASRSGGFTLIEALAALAIVAAGIAAIGSLSFSSLRSGRDVQSHLALIASARKIVAGLPQRDELNDGELHGVIDNHSWRIAAEPVADGVVAAGDASPWEPQRIALFVRGPTGAALEIDTVRLRRRASR